MNHRRKASKTLQAEYVIAGAGSAGSVLARRLSERGHDVLLVEAGPDHRPDPRRMLRRSGTRRHDWGMVSNSEKQLAGRRIRLVRGRIVGGSSAVHFGLALRAPEADFHEWAAIGGAEWSYQQILPLYKRLEQDADAAGSNHGSKGPLPIARHPPHSWVPVQQAFHQASIATGFPAVADLNAGSKPAVGPCPLNTDGRGIWSVADAYLQDRPRSLRVMSGTLVNRVLVENNIARGLEIIPPAGDPEVVWAEREVVLCGGAFGSPPIMMRSGIGPAGDLMALGIRPTVDLPMLGRNLCDHPVAILSYLLRDGVGQRTDPLFQVMLRAASETEPEFDLHILPRSSTGTFRGLPSQRLAMLLLVGFLRPKSRGHLMIRSIDPMSQPDIYMGFLEEPDDARCLATGVVLARKLVASESFEPLVEGELQPGLSVENRPDEVLRALPGIVTTYHHPTGSCRMAADANQGVVDNQCRVHGVEGLRVADASVIPFPIRANTNLTTVLVAEKCADFMTGKRDSPSDRPSSSHPLVESD